ncbi:hypothetical protein TMatcc_007193 [Talaromyces marneffei ATCC 18224]
MLRTVKWDVPVSALGTIYRYRPIRGPSFRLATIYRSYNVQLYLHSSRRSQDGIARSNVPA